MSDDRAQQEAVLARLETEPSIDAAHVGVTADHGLVTLTGHVENYFQRCAANKAAAEVTGVRAIVEELRVRMPLPLDPGDEEIARAALNRLERDESVPAHVLKVGVDAGWMTLSGEVEWHYQREAAEQAIEDLSGVVGIQNDISVSPHPLEAEVTAAIDAALRRSSSDAEAIVVTAQDGVVTLAGTAATTAAINLAGDTAWKSFGTLSVRNDLVVA